MPNILAIIPARGGSKGLPGKNIRQLAGHPLLAHSIKAAQASPSITRTILSTDDEEIASVGRKYGVEIPFMRPAELAGDMTTDWEVFDYTLRRLRQQEGYEPELVVQLRPTSPVRHPAWIEEAIRRMSVDTAADSLRIITEAPATPYKMWTLPGGEASPMQPLLTVGGMAEPFNEPRQRLPKAYWQIGTLDVLRPRVVYAGGMSGKRILPYLIDRRFAVDIDDIESFAIAEKVMKEAGILEILFGQKGA